MLEVKDIFEFANLEATLKQVVNRMDFLANAYTTLHNDMVNRRDIEYKDVKATISSYVEKVTDYMNRIVDSKLDALLKDRLEKAGIQYTHIEKVLEELQQAASKCFADKKIDVKVLVESESKTVSIPICTDMTSLKKHSILSRTLDELGISIRLANILRRKGMYVVRDLMNVSSFEFKMLRDVGTKTFKEFLSIKEKLEMEISGCQK